MVKVSVTEFKTHCLRLMEQAQLSGETIEVLKRGQPFATIVPARPKGACVSGQFKDIVKMAGEIQVDSNELGIAWEVLS